jgi:DNA-binding transcriptional LysR family regulator
LPGLIARFRRIFHQVRVDVLVTSRESVLNKLLAGDVALGVSSKILEHSDLEYQKFFDDEVILIVPPGHPWTSYRSICARDLLDEPLILREEAARSREVLMAGLRQHEILPDMLNISMVLGNAEAIVMAVEEGIGIALVSRLSASRSLELGRVVQIKVEDLHLNHTIFIARSRRLPPTRAQSEFWNFVSECSVAGESLPKVRE